MVSSGKVSPAEDGGTVNAAGSSNSIEIVSGKKSRDSSL